MEPKMTRRKDRECAQAPALLFVMALDNSGIDHLDEITTSGRPCGARARHIGAVKRLVER